jgi:16S rRNA (guanine527-N7)-methyltransferase
VSGDAARALAELTALSAGFGLTLDQRAVERLRAYVEILLFWRDRLSLTGATTAREIVLDHVLDSLHLCPQLPTTGRLADLGSGAGFPGVPIAIVCPAVAMVLVESRRKRANFLREVVRQLALQNTQVAESRAEALAVSSAETFDAVTARAFGSTATFAEAAYPLLKPGGVAIAMKGPHTRGSEDTQYEGFGPIRFLDYELPNARRMTMVVVKKLGRGEPG